MYKVRQGAKRLLSLSCNFSTRQPLFKIRKYTSICQRHKYHFSILCAPVASWILTLVSKTHSSGSCPSGESISVATTTVTITVLSPYFVDIFRFLSGGHRVSSVAYKFCVTYRPTCFSFAGISKVIVQSGGVLLSFRLVFPGQVFHHHSKSSD